MRYETLKEMDDAGVDLRLWCFACARGHDMDSIIWERFRDRGWSLELDDARQRFTCKGCRSSADVLLVPARRPKREPMTGAGLVAAYFHAMRSAGKKERRR